MLVKIDHKIHDKTTKLRMPLMSGGQFLVRSQWMIRNMLLPGLIAMLLTTIIFSCGTEEPGSDTPGPDGDSDSDSDSDTNIDIENNFYPIKVNDFWKYEETTSDGNQIYLTYTVTEKIYKEFENIITGREVFVVKNTFDTNNERRVQYIEDLGDTVVRHGHDVYDADDQLAKTRYYDPGFLRFDRIKMLKDKESWQQTLSVYTNNYEETPTTKQVVYQFDVISVGDPCQVEGFESLNCVQIERKNLSDNETKQYWYAPGIGKVKEITSGEKEEILVDSTYMP